VSVLIRRRPHAGRRIARLTQVHRGVLIAAAVGAAVVAAVLLNVWLSPAARDVHLVEPEGAAASDDGPRRIISMTPSTTEVIFALGLGDRLVGRSRFCDYPPEALDVPEVGGFLDPNYEAIAALKPDRVLLIPSHDEHRQRLEQLGIPSTVISQTSLEDILASIRTIGEMCNASDRADALIASIETRIASVRERVEDRSRPRVLLSVGRDVGAQQIEQVYAVGRGTFLDDLLDIAGAENIATEGAAEYPSFTAEAIIRLNPEVIIELVEAIRPDSGPSEDELRAAWNGLASVDAVRSGRVHLLLGDYVSIPGPRVTETLEQLVALVHPDAAPAAP